MKLSRGENEMKEFKFDIVEHIAELGSVKTITKELNRVSFNGGEPKLDIRNWQKSENGEPIMYKGISLTRDEAIKLRDALNSIEI